MKQLERFCGAIAVRQVAQGLIQIANKHGYDGVEKHIRHSDYHIARYNSQLLAISHHIALKTINQPLTTPPTKRST